MTHEGYHECSNSPIHDFAALFPRQPVPVDARPLLRRCIRGRIGYSLGRMSVYRRALRYFRPFLGETLLGTLLTLVGIGFNLLKPWPFKIIVDEILTPGKPQPVTKALARWLGPMPPTRLILCLCLAIVAVNFLAGVAESDDEHDLRAGGVAIAAEAADGVLRFLQSLPLKYHDARRSADSSFRVAYDSQAIQSIYSKGIIYFLLGDDAGGTLALMMRLDWELTLVALGIMPLVVAGDLRFREADPERIDDDPGTGERCAGGGAGGAEFHPDGACFWPRGLRGGTIPHARDAFAGGEHALYWDADEECAGDWHADGAGDGGDVLPGIRACAAHDSFGG